MDFVTIDVETANSDMATICQIGLARFSAGQLVAEWVSLVDPEHYFHPVNVSVHGIEEKHVRGKPKLPALADELRVYLDGAVCVSHTPFDRTAIARAHARYGLNPPSPQWLDSAAVVRRTWPDLSKRGYGLKNVCSRIGYRFTHHDALEDAKAAGYVLLAAIRESGLALDDWHARVTQPIDLARSSVGSAVCRTGSPEGPLHGEVIVFTGALQMPRATAADAAARAGSEVAANVSKKTTILVVGDVDVRVLAGHEKSTKHRKAEELALGGHGIRILRETDFNAMVQHL